MSSRKNGSVSRAAETASKNRLHMDRNPQHSRINDPSNPAGKRKEIDNMMKRARQASPGSWDRKLLEVEEKDPNRWRHSGYKQMYIEGSDSVSPRRSRSPVLGRRSRSPLARRSRSPVARRSRSPLAARRSPRAEREPRRDKRRTPKRTPPRRSVSPRRRSPARARRPAPPPRPHPPPPNDPRKSTSGSSVSSCSDESCSVCSAKNKKTAPPPPPKGVKLPSRSPTRLRSAGARAVQPTRELLKAREGSKRSREEKVLEWQRTQLGSRGPVTIPACQIKREGDAPVDPRRPPGAGPAGGAPRVSPSTIAAALRRASRSPSGGPAPAPRLTLSERFGKMAAWSQERAPARDNMRITRREATLHVHIEGGGAEDEGSAPASPGAYPAAPGAAPPGTPRWDDVTVRYEHYKERGYLRGLTLADYVKWEEWWYKYQEWLERERAYERWAESPRARRERRRKGPGGGRHRRS